jgi:hypothetical protein
VQGDAIQQVSTALRDRLKTIISGEVFVGPLDDDLADGAAVVLFLYRVAVNSDLRSREHVVQPPGDEPPVLYTNGLPLDLYYLLTVGKAAGGLEGLGVLGYVMQALNDDPVLVGVPVRGEVVRLTVDLIGSEEMSRIWTLFPTANYRTSVVYLASPVWIDPAEVPVPAEPVVEEPHRVGQRGR